MFEEEDEEDEEDGGGGGGGGRLKAWDGQGRMNQGYPYETPSSPTRPEESTGRGWEEPPRLPRLGFENGLMGDIQEEEEDEGEMKGQDFDPDYYYYRHGPSSSRGGSLAGGQEQGLDLAPLKEALPDTTQEATEPASTSPKVRQPLPRGASKKWASTAAASSATSIAGAAGAAAAAGKPAMLTARSSSVGATQNPSPGHGQEKQRSVSSSPKFMTPSSPGPTPSTLPSVDQSAIHEAQEYTPQVPTPPQLPTPPQTAQEFPRVAAVDTPTGAVNAAYYNYGVAGPSQAVAPRPFYNAQGHLPTGPPVQVVRSQGQAQTVPFMSQAQQAPIPFGMVPIQPFPPHPHYSQPQPQPYPQAPASSFPMQAQNIVPFPQPHPQFVASMPQYQMGYQTQVVPAGYPPMGHRGGPPTLAQPYMTAKPTMATPHHQQQQPGNPLQYERRTSGPSMTGPLQPGQGQQAQGIPSGPFPRMKLPSAGPKKTSSRDDLPITKGNLEVYRAQVKDSKDPQVLLNFAKWLVEASRVLPPMEKDLNGVKGEKKLKEALLLEAQKVVKRLASTNGPTGKTPFAEALFYLANAYGNGSLGLQLDHEKAYVYYISACKQEHPAATYRAGVCNELGVGTRKEPDRAIKFYRKAASLGDKAAQFKLGMVLLHGTPSNPSSTKSQREGVGWLRRAADQADEDNPHALHELASLYEKSPEDQLAELNVASSGAAGNRESTHGSGKENGTGTSSAGPSRKTSISAAKSATDGVVPTDESYAKELYTLAAQLGYPPSQFKLGTAYEYGLLNCPMDPRRSIAWYTRAAEKGDAESELALSGWYLTGSEHVLKQSDSEAFLWARKAANRGLAKAEYAVGYYYEVGIGTDSNIEDARKWYMRASAQGNKRAMQRLTELKKLAAQQKTTSSSGVTSLGLPIFGKKEPSTTNGGAAAIPAPDRPTRAHSKGLQSLFS